MTAYVTATLQNLLLRRISWSVRRPEPRPHAAPHWPHQDDASTTRPMFFRSEGFAEDLFDSHPTH